MIKGIKLKNLLLSILAFLLTCCFIFLLVLVTNQQVLAKVHETISSYSDTNYVAQSKAGEEKADFDSNVPDDTKHDVPKEKPYNAKNHEPIAKLATHDLNDKEAGEINLPQFSEALNKAQKMVDSDNHSENEYNDYGIDSTCEGTYYYIFTFKNKQHPKTYYRVTVDQNNKARIFDDAYKVQNHQDQDKPRISPHESEVIAQKYAKDALGNNATLKQVHASKQGMFYTFYDATAKKEYKVIVNKLGDVIRQPALK